MITRRKNNRKNKRISLKAASFAGFARRAAGALIVAAALLAAPMAPPAHAASVSSSYLSARSITAVEADSGSVIALDLPADEDYRYIRTSFMDSGGQLEKTRSQTVYHGQADISVSGLADGTYYLQLSSSSDGRAYTSVLSGKSGFIVRISGGKAEVRQSPVIYQYMDYYSHKDKSAEALYYYLRPSYRVQSNDSEMISKEAEITKGLTGAYEKAEAISRWVSGNVYYNMDARNGDDSTGPELSADALGTLRTGVAVCEGYANLTTALLRAAGIPARTCIGYGLIDSDEEWSQYKASGSAGENHAWTEAFLRGRWIEIDPTWNSKNIFYKGSGIKGNPADTYFDSTPQFFAYGHLQLRADDFSPDYMKLLFYDLKDDWSYKYIRFAVNNDIMHGTGDGQFDLSGKTTQAMFITMLSFAAGEDIKPSSAAPWYRDFDSWARRNGINTGVGGYDPAALITREQMAVMLHNFIETEDINPVSKNSGTFSDIGQASYWARNDISDLKRWGFVAGRGDGTFDPKANFTRAEAAVIITIVEDAILRDYLNT
ncbi:MAG: transglutaminase domain-containing protein [Anaerovoracaceae bacterium]|nr:transglutaminase domain-containing protein [Bacillota bacterium]MDY2671035.1 transglutaminase domain-containing protein [Anaerovoracaceae bacterium]